MTAPTVRLKLPAVLRAVQAMPWAIVPEKLTAILEVVQLRAEGGRFSPEEISARVGASREARSGDRKPMTKSGGAIAVLPLVGSVVHRASMFSEWSGGTSCQSFARAFADAMNDPSVSAIVIDCDSPGGSVDGVPELAKQIFDARGKGKQLIAVANTLMASAAYWICAAADEVVVTPSGMVGSIGVFMVHLDESQFDASVGLKYTLISAGDYKTEGNPYEPLSADAEAALQASVDDFYGMFTNAVAKYRGATPKDVRSGYGQGRVLGAQAAVAAGLADRVDTLDGVLAKLGAKGTIGGRPTGASAASATPRADDVTPEMEPDGDPDDLICPECGGAMNDDQCSACGYQVTAPDDGSETQDTATARGGAAGTDVQSPATTRPHAATEEVMPNDNGTATGNGADTREAAIAAERKRASEIRALGREHNISAEKVDALIDSGASIETATAQFLGEYRARNAGAPRISVGADREAEKPFATLGEQLVAVVQAGKPGGRVDKRLSHVNQIAAAASGMNEGVGSEGGFFIQPDLLPGVIDPVYTEDPIVSRVTRIPTSSTGVKYNVVDETARTNGNRWGGIQMYWANEADTATAKKPKLRLMELNLKKIIGIAYLTEELTQDAPAAGALLSRSFQAELGFMIGDGIFRGIGGGQMFGFLNSGALVTQAIEATQTIANTSQFIANNVTKMLSRVPASLWGGLIWLYNQELLPYLVTASNGANGAVPLFIGAGGLANRPQDTILGRPAFASELCEAVGTPGDIVAVVPSEYHMIDKGGPQQSMSVHVRFLNDEDTLKITYRTDGAPVWKQSVTPYKGANARSPFVALATRS